VSSKNIAISEINKLDDGYVSEEVAEFAFAVSGGVSKTLTQQDLTFSNKKQALRLSAILLLNLVSSLDVKSHASPPSASPQTLSGKGDGR
jgi:hypothetical protein